MLYHSWKDLPNGGKELRLQQILPQKLVPLILKQLHSAPTASHLGTAKPFARNSPGFTERGNDRMSSGTVNSVICSTLGSHPPPDHQPT